MQTDELSAFGAVINNPLYYNECKFYNNPLTTCRNGRNCKWMHINREPYDSSVIVFGYFHQLNSQTPSNIIGICAAYFNRSEEWDKYWINKQLALDVQTQTVTHAKCTNYTGGSAFLKRVIKSGIHEWRFRIEQCYVPSRKWSTMHIGVYRIRYASAEGAPRKKTRDPTHSWFAKGVERGYALSVINGKMNDSHGNMVQQKRHKIQCKNGDVIDMMLNMNALSLDFAINGEYYGDTCTIRKGHYRAAVYLTYVGDSIKLCNYKQLLSN
eukprot:203780_1